MQRERAKADQTGDLPCGCVQGEHATDESPTACAYLGRCRWRGTDRPLHLRGHDPACSSDERHGGVRHCLAGHGVWCAHDELCGYPFGWSELRDRRAEYDGCEAYLRQGAEHHDRRRG
ncbi:MAG: hypothetical protein UH084_02925 [Paludibacteraceae bacterium]|nr:hypothetical protein [Paludibacteraceae bacterium]